MTPDEGYLPDRIDSADRWEWIETEARIDKDRATTKSIPLLGRIRFEIQHFADWRCLKYFAIPHFSLFQTRVAIGNNDESREMSEKTDLSFSFETTSFLKWDSNRGRENSQDGDFTCWKFASISRICRLKSSICIFCCYSIGSTQSESMVIRSILLEFLSPVALHGFQSTLSEMNHRSTSVTGSVKKEKYLNPYHLCVFSLQIFVLFSLTVELLFEMLKLDICCLMKSISINFDILGVSL